MNEEILKSSHRHPLAFFDGTCGFCNAWVDWVLRHDPEGRIRFSPLQGLTAQRVLSESERLDLDTIIVLKNAKVLKRSTAVLEILVELPSRWRWLGRILLCVPRPLRDAVYKSVARHRYRIFGRNETCRVPTAQERTRFLE